MEKNRIATIAAAISLAASIILLAVKFWAYYLTGSEAIFSDALESIANVVASLFALTVVYFAARPADHSHPYGHGKVEFFSSGFEGGLITVAGAMILTKAVLALVLGFELQDLGFGLLLTASAGVANLLLGFFLTAVGKRVQSETLVASGEHVSSDFWTSAAVVLGLILVQITNIKLLDPLCAIGVGLYLMLTGRKIVRTSLAGLLDETVPSNLELLAQAFEKHRSEGIIQGHYTRVMRSGRYHHIDMHIVVPEFWNVKFAHDQTESFEQKVITDYSYDGEIHFHIDPCRQRYCRSCEMQECPIRLENFVERKALTTSDLMSPVEPGQTKRTTAKAK